MIYREPLWHHTSRVRVSSYLCGVHARARACVCVCVFVVCVLCEFSPDIAVGLASSVCMYDIVGNKCCNSVIKTC